MILIKSQGQVRPIKIKYMTEEGIKVSARPILVLTCLHYYWCANVFCIHKSKNTEGKMLIKSFKLATFDSRKSIRTISQFFSKNTQRKILIKAFKLVWIKVNSLVILCQCFQQSKQTTINQTRVSAWKEL